jgi:hypothetical protein
VLRDHALQPHQTSVAEQVRANLALFEVAQKDAVGATRQQPGQVGLPHAERQLSDVLAVADQAVEGIKLHFVIVLPAVQAVEIRNAVDAEQHGFTIDHERAVPVSKRSLGDQRIAIAPVVAVAGEQARVFTVALNDQA